MNGLDGGWKVGLSCLMRALDLGSVRRKSTVEQIYVVGGGDEMDDIFWGRGLLTMVSICVMRSSKVINASSASRCVYSLKCRRV